MALTQFQKNLHLIWRAGFGPMIENLDSLRTMGTRELWELLKNTSLVQPAALEDAGKSLTELAYPEGGGEGMTIQKMSAEEKKAFVRRSRSSIKDLNNSWVRLMINSKSQLREKMSLFWHGHFACRSNNGFFAQELVNGIRKNAIGNFGDMLRGVSKSAAMLQFLNNQQNRKGKPNENFAREVMELFTLGRGNYTENDIKEAARAFTGWGFDFNGNFVFRKLAHDYGSKTFRAQTGNFDGDEILTMLLKDEQTAYHITEKLWKFFVSETPDAAKIKLLSKAFYKSNYEIMPLLENMFTADWFYAEQYAGNKIKSPVELVAGIQRFLPMTLDNPDSRLAVQKVLGQILFYPPNVAGWPGGRSWIDSTTLMVRLQIPKALSANDALEIKPKTDDDMAMGLEEERRVKLGKRMAYNAKGVTATIDWKLPVDAFGKTKRDQLNQAIGAALMVKPSANLLNVAANYADQSSRENYIKTSVISMMSTPEYQLC